MLGLGQVASSYRTGVSFKTSNQSLLQEPGRVAQKVLIKRRESLSRNTTFATDTRFVFLFAILKYWIGLRVDLNLYLIDTLQQGSPTGALFFTGSNPRYQIRTICRVPCWEPLCRHCRTGSSQ